MKKTVYHNQTIDGDTGEVKSEVRITKETKNTEKFLLAYVQDMGRLAGCTAAEIKVVLASLQFVQYDTNELVLTPDRREQLCKVANTTMNSLYVVVGRLFKKQIFIKEGKKSFLNPRLFFFGKDLQKDKWFSIHLDYKILDDSDLDRTGKNGLFPINMKKVKTAA